MKSVLFLNGVVAKALDLDLTSSRFSIKEKVRASREMLVGLNFLGLDRLGFFLLASATRAIARITRLA